MKFLMTVSADPSGPPPTPAQFKAIGEYSERKIRTGKVVMTGGIVRAGHGVHLRCEDGHVARVDGPFAETKELIDGYAIVEVASREEAIAIASEFLPLCGDGSGEILQLVDPGPPGR
jgi:hypothetical protein